MKNGKFFIVNGKPKTNPPKPPSPPLSSLSAMTVGGQGDPHLYITTSSTDSKNRVSTKTIAQWGDNKPGSAGNNEIKLLDLQTSTDTIKIFYTSKPYSPNNAKIIDNMRVEYNGTSTTYSSTTRLTLGPVTLNILKAGSGSSAYLNFEITWANINNVVKLGGVIVPILKRVAGNNGVLWNGGDGALWDGIGKAVAPYGLTRSSFETGIGVQSLSEELILSEQEANFLAIADENFTQNSSIFDNLENLGENGEGDGAAIGDWDPTHAEVLPILSDTSGLEGSIDNVFVSSPTPTPSLTSTITPTPTVTPTVTSTPTATLTPTITPSSSSPTASLLSLSYTSGSWSGTGSAVSPYTSSSVFGPTNANNLPFSITATNNCDVTITFNQYNMTRDDNHSSQAVFYKINGQNLPFAAFSPDISGTENRDRTYMVRLNSGETLQLYVIGDSPYSQPTDLYKNITCFANSPSTSKISFYNNGSLGAWTGDGTLSSKYIAPTPLARGKLYNGITTYNRDIDTSVPIFVAMENCTLYLSATVQSIPDDNESSLDINYIYLGNTDPRGVGWFGPLLQPSGPSGFGIREGVSATHSMTLARGTLFGFRCGTEVSDMKVWAI